MKKGFTLVEIMVVVIIMGVLAAVGVPKLFGLIAKARAAEVPVAAGTYVSLQNAYLHENNGIGSWKNIGYGAPGDGQTEYFDYSGCINGTIVFENMEPDMPGWQASNRSGLNSCKTGSTWAIVIDPAGEREIEYRQIISSADCAALTSSWGVVGKTVEGMCAATGELHEAGTENKEPNKPATPVAAAPEDTPSEPEASSPSSSASVESSSSKQGDCDALAASIKNDNGNKYGWVCVSACGLFAPPGKARNAGFTVEKSQKKKNTGGTCEKVETETTSEGSGSQSDGSSSSPTTSTQSTGGSSGSTGTISGTPGTTGGTGGTTGGTSGSSAAVSSAESINMSAEASSSSTYPGYNGFGEPHAYDASTDYCDGTESGNSCDGTYRPNSECKTWTAHGCKKLGQGQVPTKAKCGACQEWKTSN